MTQHGETEQLWTPEMMACREEAQQPPETTQTKFAPCRRDVRARRSPRRIEAGTRPTTSRHPSSGGTVSGTRTRRRAQWGQKEEGSKMRGN